MSDKKLLEDWKKSGISRKYPTYRKNLVISVESWLEGKRADDGAEGLWRIHNTLYDFESFVKFHPGGSFWLEQTKGTDITEAFETHHIAEHVEKMLSQYKVREASMPRNYNLTFHEKGFYKTLKNRVRDKLKTVDFAPRYMTNKIHMGLLMATIGFTLASAFTGSILFQFLAALSLCWLSISAHNYFHQKDNWQMYTFNLTLMNFNNWRISHTLSHHIYPNSLHDLEMSMFEPFLCWIPNIHFGNKLKRTISLLIQPVVYTVVFHLQMIARIIRSVFHKNVLYWHDAIGLTLPLLMLLVSPASIWIVLGQWTFIIGISSFIFSLIGLNAAHHGTKIHHDGDANRADRDWGLFQVDTIIDRDDIKGSQFMVLTHFGEHALHHLFPTLDHGILPQLSPLLLQTLKEFKGQLREYNFLNQFVEQNLQLLRTKPNNVPPGKE